jgi:hypothetical protein
MKKMKCCEFGTWLKAAGPDRKGAGVKGTLKVRTRALTNPGFSGLNMFTIKFVKLLDILVQLK